MHIDLSDVAHQQASSTVSSEQTPLPLPTPPPWPQRRALAKPHLVESAVLLSVGWAAAALLARGDLLSFVDVDGWQHGVGLVSFAVALAVSVFVVLHGATALWLWRRRQRPGWIDGWPHLSIRRIRSGHPLRSRARLAVGLLALATLTAALHPPATAVALLLSTTVVALLWARTAGKHEPRLVGFAADLAVSSAPVPRDGVLDAHWQSPVALHRFDAVDVWVRCCEEVTTMAADNAQAKHVLWSAGKRLAGTLSGRGISIGMAFPPPTGHQYAGRNTRLRDPAPAVYWELEVALQRRGRRPLRFVHLLPVDGLSAKAAQQEAAGLCHPDAGRGQCPRCAVDFVGSHCPRCKGQVVDVHALRPLLPDVLRDDMAALRALAVDRGTVSCDCPACGAAMREVPLKGERIDLCLACGQAFFDDGERGRLAS